MKKNPNSDSKVDDRVVCEACGARQSVPQGDGSYACRSCGWVQHDPVAAKLAIAPAARKWWLFLLVVLLLASGGSAWWHFQTPETPSPIAAVPIAAKLGAPRPVDLGNHQVTVQDPKIRNVQKGLDWTLEELFAPALPLYDSSKLQLGKFERIIDETGLPTYRAELVNQSTDQVVIDPIMDLRLFSTDGTSQVPASIGGLPPSMYPGEKVWIKIGDEEDIKPIAKVEIHWHPSRSVALPGPRRKASIEVKSNKMRACHKRIINSEGDFSFTYQCVDLIGTLRNTDTQKMQLISVSAVYYDGQDRYVGSESTEMNKTLNPGEQTDFEMNVKLLRKRGYKRYELKYYNK